MKGRENEVPPRWFDYDERKDCPQQGMVFDSKERQNKKNHGGENGPGLQF